MSTFDAPSAQPQPPRANAIEQATGRAWTDWASWLEATGAAELGHQQLAEVILMELETGPFDQLENKPWWAQAVAVSYEQQIGRRVPGQRADGSFEATASKTVDLSRDDTWQLVTGNLATRTELFGAQIADARTSSTPKRHYWRATLLPATKIQLALESKDATKTLVTGTSQGLLSTAERDEHKRAWKGLFGELFS